MAGKKLSFGRRITMFILLFVTLGIVLLVISNRPVLEGMNYPAEAPPFIAENRSVPVAPVDVHHRLILIGDAGLYLENDPTLAALGHWAGDVRDASVLFLGDNIYDDGLIEEERAEAERILAQQLSATTVRKIVLPGNHDWGMDPAKQNLAAILNQQEFIEQWPEGNTVFAPRNGCIGPQKILLAAGKAEIPAAVLIVLDPTPFLTPRLRPACTTDGSDEEHFAQLDGLLTEHADDHVIVASHYPMVTGGPHGGLSYGVVGDVIVGVIGAMLGSLGNTYEPNYAKWISNTETVFRRNPPLIYAAGHDHNLQILESDGVVAAHVVSGAGAPNRVSTVTDIPETIFAHAAPGFVVVDMGTRDGVSVVVLRVVENGFEKPVFEMELSR